MRFIEEVGEDRGLLLASVQPFACRSFQRVAVTWSHLAYGTLDVPVEQLIGIQIRCIARQEEQLRCARRSPEPMLYQLGSVRWVPVHDQKDLAPDCLMSRSQNLMNRSA